MPWRNSIWADCVDPLCVLLLNEVIPIVKARLARKIEISSPAEASAIETLLKEWPAWSIRVIELKVMPSESKLGLG